MKAVLGKTVRIHHPILLTVGLLAISAPTPVGLGFSGGGDANGVPSGLLRDRPRELAPPEPSQGVGRIAFHSDRDTGSFFDIYTMNADGTGATRLTDAPGDDFFPAWSPGGARIAFTSERDGDYNIYAMNADGSGATQLTRYPDDDTLPG